MTIDPITLVVIQSGLKQVANEMDLVHVKTSFSTMISEGLDRANGLYHPQTGHILAQGDTGLPIFVGVLETGVKTIIDMNIPVDPGDIIMCNDPYMGGTHLMDVRFVAPFFYKGKLWCYLGNVGHWVDIGGMVPGGFAATATEIEQEGLRIPPLKLYRKGVLNQDLLDLMMSNMRVAEERIGDILSQKAALDAGAARLTALLDRYGEETVTATMAILDDKSEQQMRAYISTIPEGRYSFTAPFDSDGIEHKPFFVHLDLEVKDGELHLDLSKSSEPCQGPLNAPFAVTRSAIFIAVKHVFPDVPINSGCFRPIKIKRPTGTFLDARYPRPVSGCSSEVSQRVIESVFGALGKAMPDRMFAAPYGTSGNFSLGGYDPDRGGPFVMASFSGGGYGGSRYLDGLTNGTAIHGISKTQPVEMLEQLYPVMFEEWALREESAGAGEHRGGYGISYRVKLLRGDAKASFIMDHARIGPHGLAGGERGATNELFILRVGREPETLEHLSKGAGIHIRAGDRVQIRTPGGGGYGSPRDRDRDTVRDEMAGGYISVETARSVYGLE